MSWDQSYSVPSVVELLEQLTGKDSLTLLEKALALQGVELTKIEDVMLSDGDWDGPIMGKRIHLSDGRVFEPKLVRRETANGNWGNDVFEYKLQDETVEVEQVDLSEGSEPAYYGGCDLGCGCGGDDGGC